MFYKTCKNNFLHFYTELNHSLKVRTTKGELLSIYSDIFILYKFMTCNLNKYLSIKPESFKNRFKK
ncbi:MAG: hypothetical protein BAJALOKI1v1_1420006 [Promethearchaeota archaeon]|nr:MAG: hypothetical protein BAJALOKI1v1_1420006 [Candidatus Lokiarchaeota archaeon]